MTFSPCCFSCRASLPIVVVLPAPLTPTTRIANGAALRSIVERLLRRPQDVQQRAAQRGEQRIEIVELLARDLATQLVEDALRGLDADVRGDQPRLELVEHRVVDAAAGQQVREVVGQPRIAAVELLAQALEQAGPGGRRRFVGLGFEPEHRCERVTLARRRGAAILSCHAHAMPRPSGKKSAGKKTARTPRRNRLRIIGGRWRGSRIVFPAARGDPALAGSRARDAVQLAATADRGRALPGSVRGQRCARPRSAVARCCARDVRRSRAAGRPSSDANARAARQPRCDRRGRGRAALPAASAAAVRHRLSRPAVRLGGAGAGRQPAAAGLAGAGCLHLRGMSGRSLARRRCPRSWGVQRTKRAGQVGYHLLRASDPAKEVPP